MIILSLLLFLGHSSGELYEVASWRLLTFAPPAGYPAPNPLTRPVFTGLEVTADRLYLSMPRYGEGQPITLGWVPKPPLGTRLPTDTTINPFPDWEWHRSAATGVAAALNDCNKLISVFRSRVDHCGRLWVLDGGVLHSPGPTSRACPPKLLVFNAASGQLLRRLDFRGEILRANSLFINLVLDTRNPANTNCDSMYVYIADSTAPAIVVYDVLNDRSWRLSAPEMYASPDHGKFNVTNEIFYMMDGITGMALSTIFQGTVNRPNTGFTDRYLYFQALSSDRIYSVDVNDLLSGPKVEGTLPVTLLGYKPSQGIPLAVERRRGTDRILFSTTSETWVVSWDPTQNQSELRAYNTDLLQFLMDLVVEGDQIWAISTRFQKFFNNKVNPTEVNLRILRIDRT